MKRFSVPPRAVLTIMFATIVFGILVITMSIIGVTGFMLVRTGILRHVNAPGMMVVLLILALASVVVGTVVGAIFSRVPLKPVNVLINGMNRLASGDYRIRIDIGNVSIAQKVSDSFNTLAEELQHTEMLRSDFVNNFSHEFKTPIVSIRGFAKILQKGNVSDLQQKEYLNIIVEESTRLADMATGVLNLAKVENQSILTDITVFNLSEQIRGCVLLLEKRWSQKDLTITVPFDEYFISANEELLKQVWINLIDNAVKFSSRAAEIVIAVTEEKDIITVSIKNYGPEIGAGDQKRIFDKFWQGDSSHAAEGTGIGLSIARRITELHRGSISVVSSPVETIFSVRLPKE